MEEQKAGSKHEEMAVVILCFPAERDSGAPLSVEPIQVQLYSYTVTSDG